jgi:hypothetical protein
LLCCPSGLPISSETKYPIVAMAELAAKTLWEFQKIPSFSWFIAYLIQYVQMDVLQSLYIEPAQFPFTLVFRSSSVSPELETINWRSPLNHFKSHKILAFLNFICPKP